LNTLWDERTERLHEESRAVREPRFIARKMKLRSTRGANVVIDRAKRARSGTAACGLGMKTPQYWRSQRERSAFSIHSPLSTFFVILSAVEGTPLPATISTLVILSEDGDKNRRPSRTDLRLLF
jgi:hypothetical protein